ncbi:MAG TPA: WYL domain-containing transcriptional regulator [Mogibacterium sp.]|nr:WYL domain-containing transcriptional regulator [Mogibacterium sp.]
MAYSELIKNFNRIREYMREFYVYGFKSREEFNNKSSRSYDDERRRVENWLGDYMNFRTTSKGKNVFISIDSRMVRHNPLYKAWKAKSFTDGDITLHFLLFDILSSPEKSLNMREIIDEMDERLSGFENPKNFDESTVRKKLKEYIEEGLIISEKRGRSVYYKRAADDEMCSTDCLDFFSEVSPCGVIGSCLLDRIESPASRFAFKHHYITSAMDSEILRLLLEAINDKKSVICETKNCKRGRKETKNIVPLKIFVSVQNGRQYLMGYSENFNRIMSKRVDSIDAVKIGEKCDDFDYYRETLDKMQSHMWGVSTQSQSGQRMEHVDFTVKYNDREKHIHQRLEREKRCGTVERLDENTSRFSADIYDAWEMVPWIRTFICRITEINFSNKELEKQFREDIKEMYRLYGLCDSEGGEGV